MRCVRLRTIYQSMYVRLDEPTTHEGHSAWYVVTETKSAVSLSPSRPARLQMCATLYVCHAAFLTSSPAAPSAECLLFWLAAC